MIDKCESVYHGLLKNGLTYSMNLMLNHYQNQQLKFENNPASRTYEMLLEMNQDEITLRLSEVKDFILDKVFVDYKDRATKSTTNYYAKLISYYTILYGVFVVCMTFFILFFFLYYYIRIKDTMWKSNLTLKIMPMDFIPK